MSEVIGAPSVQYGQEFKPPNQLVSVMKMFSWCLLTYRSGRQEPMAVTGVVTFPEVCPPALHEAKVRNAARAHRAYLRGVKEFAEQGFFYKANHRARPIVALEWVDESRVRE